MARDIIFEIARDVFPRRSSKEYWMIAMKNL
jgi:hypothetical protein